MNMGTINAAGQIEVERCTDWNSNTRWTMRFPLSEIGNAIAICGWNLANFLPRTAEVDAELDRLSQQPYLDIPESGWWTKHATKIA